MSESRQRFAGKGVVVTGAAQGIGRAVASGFAAEGAGVVLLDNDAEVLARTAETIRASGAAVEAVPGDVSRREDVRRAVELAVERFGHLDVAVQVAGIADFVPFLEVTDESWDRILGVNLRGTWYLLQEAGRAMVRQGIRGAMAVTASTNAFQPEASGLAYNTSKSGQVAVMHTAALELAPHGIRVNAVAPGIIDSPLHTPESHEFLKKLQPAGRLGTIEEIADAVIYLAGAGFTNGIVLPVDGGATAGNF